jgi:hypothetical protein
LTRGRVVKVKHEGKNLKQAQQISWHIKTIKAHLYFIQRENMKALRSPITKVIHSV